MSYKATKLLTVGLMAIACVLSILKVHGFLTDVHMSVIQIERVVVVRWFDNCLMKLASIIILPLSSVATCFSS